MSDSLVSFATRIASNIHSTQKKWLLFALRGYPVGFLTWVPYDRTAKIQIAEIKPGHRKQGLGTKLTDALFHHLRAHGIFAVRLHCHPQKSEWAWKKIGFKNFPDVRGSAVI